MLVMLRGRLLNGFGGGLRHGSTWGVHLLGVLLMIAATVVFAAAATAAMSDWTERRFHNENSTKLAGWVTFVIVFGLLGWLTLRVV